MASSGVTNPSVVSVEDLLRLLDNPWLYRVWTYQEIMLSENPILVHGTMMMPWWRFAMSVLYLRITEHWADVENIHTSDSTSDLFKSLRVWRALVLDRNAFHISRRYTSSSSKYTTLDLQLYNRFLSDIADRFLSEFISWWGIGITSLQILLMVVPLAFAIVVPLIAWYSDLGFTTYDARCILFMAWCIETSFCIIWYSFLSINLDHTVRRPRRKYLSHNPGTWPEESSAKNIILSAIWTRQCKERKDFNFGTRNLMQALSGQNYLA